MLLFKHQLSDIGFDMSDVICQISDIRSENSNVKCWLCYFRIQTLDVRCQMSDRYNMLGIRFISPKYISAILNIQRGYKISEIFLIPLFIGYKR